MQNREAAHYTYIAANDKPRRSVVVLLLRNERELHHSAHIPRFAFIGEWLFRLSGIGPKPNILEEAISIAFEGYGIVPSMDGGIVNPEGGGIPIQVGSYNVNLHEVVYSLSNALDLVGVNHIHHGKRVAYMATEVGKRLGWSRHAG